jgi:hypothetical protein
MNEENAKQFGLRAASDGLSEYGKRGYGFPGSMSQRSDDVFTPSTLPRARSTVCTGIVEALNG